METVNEFTSTKQYNNKLIQRMLETSQCEIRTDANLFSTCASEPTSNNVTIIREENPDNSLLSQSEESFFGKTMYTPTYHEKMNDCIVLRKSEFYDPENEYRYVTTSFQNKNRECQSEPESGFPITQDMKFIITQPSISREVLGEIYGKTPENSHNNADAKVEEVMKAAKSLFSKRTRTLYHWMHPNAPKQQIKAAVTASWESLGAQEKQFYISQVLGRFGFPQCNLMVNPQLGGIKELPPAAPQITDYNGLQADELQNAITSITTDRNIFISDSAFRNNNRKVVKRKRLGRPPGSKNKKSATETWRTPQNQDFQDDPELSEELQQFAMNLNIP